MKKHMETIVIIIIVVVISSSSSTVITVITGVNKVVKCLVVVKLKSLVTESRKLLQLARA